jgi:hypothetical protein
MWCVIFPILRDLVPSSDYALADIATKRRFVCRKLVIRSFKSQLHTAQGPLLATLTEKSYLMIPLSYACIPEQKLLPKILMHDLSLYYL